MVVVILIDFGAVRWLGIRGGVVSVFQLSFFDRGLWKRDTVSSIDNN